MEPYDWISKIKTNILILRIMGLWPKSEKNYQQKLYTFYAIILISTFALGHIFFQLVYVCFVANNLRSFAATSYLLFIEMLGPLKAYYLTTNMKILKERLNTFKSEWFQPRNIQQKKMIEPSISFCKTVCIMFNALNIGCNAFWAIYPIVDKSDERRLPFLGWYPYDYKRSPFYEITYGYQVFSIGYLSNVHMNVDTLIAVFNIYAACQLDILRDNLTHMTDVDPEGEDNVFDKMMECVSHHKNIVHFLEDSMKFYNWILLWHLLFSSVSIGITMFQLTVVEPMSNEFYGLLSYGFAIIVQIFSYCWFANEVEAKSSHLAYAIFECDWIDLSEDIKKKMLFFAMQLQKPLQISALNLFQLSLETYMRILKTSWSYFTLLYQISSKK